MSQEAEIMFEIERQRRQELYRARVRNKTQEFYQRYREQYENMRAQGYADYIPEEMRQLERDLNTVSSLLSGDPEAAREVSQEIGTYIHSLWGLGREAEKTFHETARLEAERIRQERAAQKNLALSRYYAIISEVESIAASLAENDITAVRQAVLSGEISAPQEVEARLAGIIESAKKQAADWKEKKLQEQKRQSMIAQIEEQEKSLQADRYEDRAKGQAILERLANIKRKAVSGSLETEDMNRQLREITQESDEAVVSENVRREVVAAIYKWFSSHDFTVSKPQIKDGNVILTAQRPSGNRAQFMLRMDNKMFYRLDGYEGQSCLKDISAAKADWESVYGIKLTGENIRWQNPDRVLRRQTMTSTSMGGNMQ